MIKVRLIFNKNEYSQYLFKHKISPFHPNDEYPGFSSFERLLRDIDFSKENLFTDKKVMQIMEEYETLWHAAVVIANSRKGIYTNIEYLNPFRIPSSMIV